MESKIIPMKKHIIIYSVILGLGIIIYSFLTYITGNYTMQNLFHYSILFLLTITPIIASLISFKKNNNQFISLGEALKIGIAITIFGGLLVTLWEILLIRVIDPEIITQIADDQIKKVAEKSNNFTKENIERKIEITNKFTSPLVMLLMAFIEDVIVGFLFSLITGLIIRKKRDPFK